MTEQKPSFRRQSITLAVAAAVFALSGTAWGADYNRITTTIEDSSVDASVTYTEVTSPVNTGTATPDLTFHYVPVQPEANSPITLTLNSLTVTNETTAGDVTVNTQVQDPAYPEDPTKLLDQTATYSKNGNGIATNTGAGITLELTEGLTVTTRDTAVSAADAATIS